MMWRGLRTLVLGLVAVTTLAATALAQDDPIKIRLQAAVPSASIYYELLQRYADRIGKMSNGRVAIEVLPDGAIVSAFEILDAVDQGIVEAGYAWTHYWSGKHPAAGLFSNPMAGAGSGMDQLSHVSWLLEGEGNALYKRFYTEILGVDIEPFMVQPMGPDPLGWFARPIESVADFQKLKYRSPPGITGEIFKEMGIAAVGLPGGEIVPSASQEEKFYVVLEGEVTFETPDGSAVLGTWDSCRIAPNETRALRNETKRPAVVLLAMPLPSTARG